MKALGLTVSKQAEKQYRQQRALRTCDRLVRGFNCTRIHSAADMFWLLWIEMPFNYYIANCRFVRMGIIMSYSYARFPLERRFVGLLCQNDRRVTAF